MHERTNEGMKDRINKGREKERSKECRLAGRRKRTEYTTNTVQVLYKRHQVLSLMQ
jgi:hypothetical protein